MGRGFDFSGGLRMVKDKVMHFSDRTVVCMLLRVLVDYRGGYFHVV